jgi:hypothetical protein
MVAEPSVTMKQIVKLSVFVSVLVLGFSHAVQAQAQPYALGTLPAGFAVRWPAAPTISRQVEVRTAAQFNSAAAVAGTRLVVKASIPSAVVINASNIEVRMDPGVSVAGLTIAKALRRIRLQGGSYTGGGINLAYPTNFYPTRVDNPAWVIEDVMIDGVNVRSTATTSALNLRGNRIAVVRSVARGGEYGVYTGTIPSLQSNDLILAGNVLQSEGDQATVRLVGVRHSVTVDNRIENLMLTGSKHAYRVHAISDQVIAARNLLVNGGTMFGTMAGDDIGEMWFEDNVIHHRTDDLFHPDTTRVFMLHAIYNSAYSARTCFMCVSKPASWQMHDNGLFPYTAPPATW